jgi:diguanylate cyclase (GGDEF)-like protein
MEDVVARYGGDEFVVVFWDAESPRIAGSQHPQEAMEIMNRFQTALRQHEIGCLGPKAKGVLTISGGLATYPWDATTVGDLLKVSERALREAKRSGKNSIHLIGSRVVA